MEIQLKRKYLIHRSVIKNKYSPRTGKSDRAGYRKGAHSGCCQVPRYRRASRHASVA